MAEAVQHPEHTHLWAVVYPDGTYEMSATGQPLAMPESVARHWAEQRTVLAFIGVLPQPEEVPDGDGDSEPEHDAG